MKRTLSVLFSILISLCIFSPAYAYTINYDSTLDTKGILTTTQGYASVWDFETNNLNSRPPVFSSIAIDSAAIVKGSVSGQYAAPFVVATNKADDTYYLTVPAPYDNDHTGSISVSLSTPVNYFGMFWGSIDSYNTIEFFNGSQRVAFFAGTDLPVPSEASGNQTALASNLYVNFFDLTFDSFRLGSTNFAFEVDNIAVGTKPVPEPATMLLLASGLVGLAGVRRKFKK